MALVIEVALLEEAHRLDALNGLWVSSILGYGMVGA
jgi:hypothetical protein